MTFIKYEYSNESTRVTEFIHRFKLQLVTFYFFVKNFF